jgi:hypothetical protein
MNKFLKSAINWNTEKNGYILIAINKDNTIAEVKFFKTAKNVFEFRKTIKNNYKIVHIYDTHIFQ